MVGCRVKKWLVRTEADARVMVAELRRLTWDLMKAGKFPVISIAAETRTDAQNRHMRALCNCFVKSKIEWPRGSAVIWTDPEWWKIYFVSAINYDPSKIAMGMHGELINFGYSSKALTKPVFSDLIELMYAEGCERGVTWSSRALDSYEECKYK